MIKLVPEKQTVKFRESRGKIELNKGGVAYEEYSGSYEVIPTEKTQKLETAGKVLLQDITVKPIPKNYGLITWNGSELTIS